VPVLFGFFLLAAVALAQQAPQAPQPPPDKAPPAAQNGEEDNPPEEDDAQKPTVYSFNPIQAEHEMKVGAFYMHKGSYRAAAKRFEEASRWNPGLADAFFRLGEAREKLKEKDAARTAYARVVQLAPDSKEGREAKHKLAGKL